MVIDFHGLLRFGDTKVREPVAIFRVEVWPLEEDGRHQFCRPGGLDAWMQTAWEAGGSHPGVLEAGLQDWIGLDWM
jgi:hypothetical protein